MVPGVFPACLYSPATCLLEAKHYTCSSVPALCNTAVAGSVHRFNAAVSPSTWFPGFLKSTLMRLAVKPALSFPDQWSLTQLSPASFSDQSSPLCATMALPWHRRAKHGELVPNASVPPRLPFISNRSEQSLGSFHTWKQSKCRSAQLSGMFG